MGTPPRRVRCSPLRLLVVAIAWLVAAAVFAAISIAIPAPGAMREPRQRHRIFAEAPVVVVRTSSETVLPFVKADRTSPTYALNCSSRSVSNTRRSITWGAVQSSDSTLGFYRRSDDWSYTLSASRLDSLPVSTELPLFASETTCTRWRPLLVDYLNADSGGKRVGDDLEVLLNTPIHRESWVCWQNALVLGAWLGVLAGAAFMLGAVAVLLTELIRGSPKSASTRA